MPQFGRLSKIHLLAAIRDYTTDDEVLERYELDPDGADVMAVERGKQYDARVLVLSAYEKVTGERLTGGDLPADLASLLTRLELKAVSRRELIAAQTLKSARQRVPGTPRAARPKAPSAPAQVEKPVALCPTCWMQLPATGRCDNCD
ncbi:hypothetical protein [Nocardioides sp. Kera G14]|uniref:hypothetical protein n=1 Tax=Nocardioides sp. Kera G14 TaxID=2884264 RepID=UPI001D101951|nr:hypothetical protein [Nocardioides sp. Kera G14]UDY24579.1 hypothetical protein LH076_04545 [Nocardioides sp. Kera G14]